LTFPALLLHDFSLILLTDINVCIQTDHASSLPTHRHTSVACPRIHQFVPDVGSDSLLVP